MVSDSDDVQTISSGSEDNKDRDQIVKGGHKTEEIPDPTHFLIIYTLYCFVFSYKAGPSVIKKQTAVKSTRGFALKNSHSMMVKSGAHGGGAGPSSQGGKHGQQGQQGGGENALKNTRLFFDGEESCYIIDAKLEGNLGRYLNVRR